MGYILNPFHLFSLNKKIPLLEYTYFKKKDEKDLICTPLLVNECNNPKLTILGHDISGKGI